jgi:fatty acid desaturase
MTKEKKQQTHKALLKVFNVGAYLLVFFIFLLVIFSAGKPGLIPSNVLVGVSLFTVLYGLVTTIYIIVRKIKE